MLREPIVGRQRTGTVVEEFGESELFAVLSNDRRREIINQLSTHERAMPLQEIAKHVAVAEADERRSAVDRYKSVYVSLQQTHVPKLVETGVVEHDEGTNLLFPGPRFDSVESYLRNARDQRAPRESNAPYLWIGTVGIALIVVLGLDAFSLGPEAIRFVSVGTLLAAFAISVLRETELR
ncbi:DUF7344 domain-containing protein [Halegenticoccus soli]|uniref:DUF7344 domain-containing protein n=1 Tax=Halegenticoccus soli TaxID=1985678 RepID=UPI000C6EA7C6|nr:transcriptional regulator [Halegenticoccus soli]